MILHFAYGSNMSRKLMRRHAPNAQPVGVGRLANHRFFITGDGYASVASAPGQTVHGVVWRLTPRDRVTLDAWENVAAGLYLAQTLPVFMEGRRVPALVYVARPGGEGKAKPGYMDLVIAAAHEWRFGARYIEELEGLLPPRHVQRPVQFKGPARKFGESG